LFTKITKCIGSYDFDKFAESERQKRGTAEVDAEFLKEIESWREALAKDIALKNPRLTVPELNFAVQLTIDRIIFLRMCEDRGIERYGRIEFAELPSRTISGATTDELPKTAEYNQVPVTVPDRMVIYNGYISLETDNIQGNIDSNGEVKIEDKAHISGNISGDKINLSKWTFGYVSNG
jgi:hypothetical protein